MSKALKPHEKWAQIASQVLVGKTIKEVRYLNPSEQSKLGWDNASIVMIFTDGSYAFPSQDDEGNGAGALFTSDERAHCIPVIWS